MSAEPSRVAVNCTNLFRALGNAGRGAKVLTVIEREQKVAQNGAKIVKDVRGSGRSKNKLKPNPEAQGAHTVFKRDQASGKITQYETFERTKDAREPRRWISTKQYHTIGKDPRGHFSKETNAYSGYPHIHDSCENKVTVRAPFLSEIPR